MHPLATISCFALLMSFISLWVYRSIWIWGPFLIISCTLAYLSDLITQAGLISLATLLFLHLILKMNIQGAIRVIFVAVTATVSVALWLHFLPGFCSWSLFDQHLSLDQPLVGLFPLALILPLVQSKAQAKNVAIMSVSLSLLGVLLLYGIAVYAGLLKFGPHCRENSLFFLFFNLLFVVIPLEGFLRGVIQKEIFEWLGKQKIAHVGAVVTTGLLFSALYISSSCSPSMLAFLFLVGCVYGAIYQYTLAVESAIFCHFLFNLIHFFFFATP